MFVLSVFSFFRKAVCFPNWSCVDWLQTLCPSLTLKTAACWTSAALTRKQLMSSVTSHSMSFKSWLFCRQRDMTPLINMQKKCFNILIWKSCFCSMEWSPNVIEYPAGWISCSENHGEQIHEMTCLLIFIQCVFNLVRWNNAPFWEEVHVSDLHWK